MAAQIYSGTYTGDSPNVKFRVVASVGTRGVTSVPVTFKVYGGLPYSQSWLGTGHSLTVGIYVAGSWHNATLKSSSSSWSGTAEHSTSISVTVPVSPSQSSIAGISFRASGYATISGRCSNIGIPAHGEYNGAKNAKLTVVSYNNNSITVKVSGMSTTTGNRAIEWILGSTRLESTGAKGTEQLYVFKGLVPNTGYKLGANVTYGGSTLVSLTATQMTTNEVMAVSATPSDTYVTLNISGLMSNPQYQRKVNIYYKSNDGEYVFYDKVDTPLDTLTVNVTGLSMVTEYTFKVELINDDNAAVFITKEVTAKTTLNQERLPQPLIKRLVMDKPGGTLAVEWISDRDLTGTIYTIEVTGNPTVTRFKGETTEYEISQDAMYSVKITSSYPGTSVTKGDVKAIYVGMPFDFSTETKRDALDVNLLISKIDNLLRNRADRLELSVVNLDDIKASEYNLISSSLSKLISSFLGAKKQAGDKVYVSDFGTLKTAYNRVRIEV